MQLLVSVATPAEARHAVDGGADLIDAKDPSAGALGAVSLDTLRQIHALVAGRRIVTAALGDATDEKSVERVAFNYGSIGVGFVKVGFAGTTDPSHVERLLRAAVRGVRATGVKHCGVVAVGYADTGGAKSAAATVIVDIAARAGVVGVLLDTADKDGPGLRQLLDIGDVIALVARAHKEGLLVALAGKLTLEDLAWLNASNADIVGVRGAACAKGRASRVVEAKVRALNRAAKSLTLSTTGPGTRHKECRAAPTRLEG
jgi:uncharacterized protein (UPF0264 family)